MGEAKRRKAALAAGKPWALQRSLPNAVMSNDQTQLLSQLDGAERAATAEQIQRAREMARHFLKAARQASEPKKQLDTVLMLARGMGMAIDMAIEQYRTSSEDTKRMHDAIQCRKGCWYCCHINVAVSILEAILIARAIRELKLADLEARVKETAPTIAGLTPKQRHAKIVTCPFLLDGLCGIYPVRPGSCRAYLSLSVQQCMDDFESAKAGTGSKGVTTVAVPMLLSSSIGKGVQLAMADEGLQDCVVELTAAVNVLLSDDTAMHRWLSGETVFQPYVH